MDLAGSEIGDVRFKIRGRFKIEDIRFKIALNSGEINN